MGTPTNLYVMTVRSTRRGSDHYGTCELCGEQCSEHFVATYRRVYVREDGRHYLSAASGGTYGHLSCLKNQYGDLVSEDKLERDGNIRLLPPWAVKLNCQASIASWGVSPANTSITLILPALTP